MKSLVQKIWPHEKCQFSNCSNIISSHCMVPSLFEFNKISVFINSTRRKEKIKIFVAHGGGESIKAKIK